MSGAEDFANGGGEALELGDGQFSEDEEEEEEQIDAPKPESSKKASPAKDKVENEHFDMAFEVNESEGEEIDSGEEDDVVQ
jgi:hypothetical protein